MWTSDLDLDEPLTFDAVAETVGARRSLVVRLAQQGLIETIDAGADEAAVAATRRGPASKDATIAARPRREFHRRGDHSRPGPANRTTESRTGGNACD